MARILTIDIATTSAAAFAVTGERPLWCHERFGKPGASAGEVGARFEYWLESLAAEHLPGYLIFESPFARPPLRDVVIRRLYGMAMVAEVVGHRRGMAVREVDTPSVAKFFTGQARWGSREAKKAATKRVCARYGWSPVTEDEADALAVLAYAEALIDPSAAARRGLGPLFVEAGQPRP
jgi:hypothetical protein